MIKANPPQTLMSCKTRIVLNSSYPPNQTLSNSIYLLRLGLGSFSPTINTRLHTHPQLYEGQQPHTVFQESLITQYFKVLTSCKFQEYQTNNSSHQCDYAHRHMYNQQRKIKKIKPHQIIFKDR